MRDLKETISVFSTLAVRDSQRRQCSLRPNSHYRSPEDVFYSVANSVRNKEDNRYSDILSYDRTSVIVGDKGYLNANIVCSGGYWWVAAQVSTSSELLISLEVDCWLSGGLTE